MLKICLILALLAATASAQCESGWSPLGQSCYRRLPGNQPFEYHRSNCAAVGGRLVSIASITENNFVNQLQLAVCTSGICPMYIGLQRNNAGQFTSWLDGTPFGGAAYSNWNMGEPSSTGAEKCVEMLQGNGKWNDISCTLGRVAMCEKPQCETGWAPLDQCCYRLLTALQPFEAHRTDCLNLGGKLVSVNSDAENTLINQRQQAGCSGTSCNAFIGLRRNSAGQFSSWLDGTPFGAGIYANWNKWTSNEPNNVGGNENCAEVVYATGLWNDISCDIPRIAVCENCDNYATTTSTSTTTSTTTTITTPTTTTTTTPTLTTTFTTTEPTTESTTTPTTAESTTTPTTTESTTESTTMRTTTITTTATPSACQCDNVIEGVCTTTAEGAVCNEHCRIRGMAPGFCIAQPASAHNGNAASCVCSGTGAGLVGCGTLSTSESTTTPTTTDRVHSDAHDDYDAHDDGAYNSVHYYRAYNDAHCYYDHHGETFKNTASIALC